MKRSGNLRLVLMAAAAVPVLAGCEQEPTGQVLSSIEQCASQTQVEVAQCEDAYRNAVAEHQRVAPRFESKVECDAQFENCNAVEEDGRTVYHPPMGGFLMGYLIGSALSPRGYYPVAASSPLYRDARGGYYKPNGDFAGNRIGNVSGNRGKVALPARAVTVSRAGFGSSAAARGGFGSGRGTGG
ncbi:MAG TPA: DUF1190 domain-containing protein [Lysobacter sp.]